MWFPRAAASAQQTFDGVKRYVEARRGIGALAMLITLIAASFAIKGLAESLVEGLRRTLNIDPTLVYSALLLSAGLALFCLVLGLRRRIVKQRLAFPDPRQLEEDLEVLEIRTLDQLKAVQRLAHNLFGDETPDDQTIFSSFEKNSRRSVALFSHAEEMIVGFASIWPIKDSIAKKMLLGEILEKDFKIDYMLPASRNQTANYAMVPGIGVLDAHTPEGRARATVLIRGFRKFVREQFLSHPEREMTVFATAFSDSGKRWCCRMGMVLQGVVGDPPHPLYAGKFKASNLEPKPERELSSLA